MINTMAHSKFYYIATIYKCSQHEVQRPVNYIPYK